MAAEFSVELRGIRKTFPGVVANHDVNVQVRSGEVHAICGENGAGKSTLMKMLYGMLKPDAGTIAINGTEIALHGPKDAIAHGIGMVHQHFMLADNLTVAENVVLGLPGRLRLTEAQRAISELGIQYGLTVDPSARVAELSVGQRQRVEILKVLYRGAKIIILDEPTAVLVPAEVEALFSNLAELRAEGLTVLFISHKLDEVLAVADRVTVLRGGTSVRTMAAADTNATELAQLMVGQELPSPQTTQSTVREHVALRLKNVSMTDDGRQVLSEISLQIRVGEVLGIAGVEGNGQNELVDAIMGLRASTGLIELGGDGEDSPVQRLDTESTRRRRAAGIALIPEDRQRQALLLTQPLWENRLLGWHTVPPLAAGPFIDTKQARADTAAIIDEYGIKAVDATVPAMTLSGGNQQKLVIGRELAANPRVLLAAHPTRGVDVGAQAQIWRRLRQARAAGLAVLLISADLEELLGLSDTLMVMLRGRMVAELDPATVTSADLGAYMTGARAA